MYFFKNLLLYSGAYFKQNKRIIMMTKEGSPEIVNFITSGAGVLALGVANKTYSEKCIYPLKIFFFPPMHRSDKLSIK